MEITTPRLVLRDIVSADEDAILAIFCHPDTQRFEDPGLSEFVAYGRVQMMAADQFADPRTRYYLVVTLQESGEIIGYVSARLNNKDIREWEMGWTIRSPDWGKGYASEAARALLEWTVANLGAHRVVAFCHAENRASSRVMEKVGMTREGRLRETRKISGEWHDEFVYAILDREVFP